MNAARRRFVFWAVLGAALTAGLIYAFRPQAVPVDLATVTAGRLVVTVDEEGETRVHDVFELSAPVTGRVRRIDAEVGDPVVANQTVVAEIEPIDPTLLDVRTEAQAQAALRAAEANKALAEAELAEAQAEFEFAEGELKRARRLREEKTISERELDDATRRYKTTRANVATARSGLEVRRFELERARAQLMSPVHSQSTHLDCKCVPLLAPVSGSILRVLHKSEGVVEAGAPLVEIGNPGDLEIVVDYLSSDAVKISPGQRAMIEQWGGGETISASVRRVEPSGFTKVSALGIEEQRVNVIMDFTSPREAWQRLGHGYQVEARVVLWEGTDVRKLPLTALFRSGDQWAVFLHEKGRAHLRVVKVGRRSRLEAEIVEGVDTGDRVVVSPSDRISDGVRIVPRR
jgi:HlyD family secretion protein